MFFHVFLGDAVVKPATFEIVGLLEEVKYVGVRLQAQSQRHLNLTVSLILLVQTYINKSF